MPIKFKNIVASLNTEIIAKAKGNIFVIFFFRLSNLITLRGTLISRLSTHRWKLKIVKEYRPKSGTCFILDVSLRGNVRDGEKRKKETLEYDESFELKFRWRRWRFSDRLQLAPYNYDPRESRGDECSSVDKELFVFLYSSLFLALFLLYIYIYSFVIEEYKIVTYIYIYIFLFFLLFNKLFLSNRLHSKCINEFVNMFWNIFDKFVFQSSFKTFFFF